MRVLRLGGLACALAALLLVIGEVLCRIVAPPPPGSASLQHPFIGIVRPAGYRAEKISIDTGERFTYETDALGFRGRSLATAEKPAGTYRIFFLGASTTENSNTPESDTFPGVVEEKLTARFQGRPRIEVGNAGVSGAGSHASLAQVAHRLLALSPDLICVMDAVIDLTDSQKDDWDPTTFRLAAKAPPPRFRDWLVARSRLVGLIDARLGSSAEIDPRPFFAAKAALRKSLPVKEPGTPLLRGLDEFRANQRRLVLLCQDAGVACALMTEPTLYKKTFTPEEEGHLWNTLIMGTDYNLRPETLLEGITAYNEAVRRTAQETGALLVDLDARVDHAVVNFADDVHFTRAGNAAVADAIVAELLLHGDPLPRFRKP